VRSVLTEHDPTTTGDFGVIFAECHINYRSPGFYDELLEIVLTIDDVRRSSFRVNFTMRVGERLLAEGWGALVGYDYAAAKAAPLPDAVREQLLAMSSAP
jgi:acyl-CoA thioester hydrolase